jgi:hypothetical protein
MTANTFVVIYMWVSFFVALLLIRDICILRNTAFKEAGHSKRLWLFLSLVSLVTFLSIPLLLCYVIRIRPSVASADSAHLNEREDRKALRRQEATKRRQSHPAPQYRGPANPGQRSSVLSQRTSFTMSPQKPAEKIRIPCGHCGSSRWITDAGGRTIACTSCGGRGYHLGA